MIITYLYNSFLSGLFLLLFILLSKDFIESKSSLEIQRRLILATFLAFLDFAFILIRYILYNTFDNFGYVKFLLIETILDITIFLQVIDIFTAMRSSLLEKEGFFGKKIIFFITLIVHAYSVLFIAFLSAYSITEVFTIQDTVDFLMINRLMLYVFLQLYLHVIIPRKSQPFRLIKLGFGILPVGFFLEYLYLNYGIDILREVYTSIKIVGFSVLVIAILQFKFGYKNS